MPRFLIAIHRPNNYDPTTAEDDAMRRNISALNNEMEAAGIRVFVGGLHPISGAKSVRAQSDGTTVVTDEQYLNSPEHVGGFWVLDVKDMDEALAWGRKAVTACKAQVEVRQFH